MIRFLRVIVHHRALLSRRKRELTFDVSLEPFDVLYLQVDCELNTVMRGNKTLFDIEWLVKSRT